MSSKSDAKKTFRGKTGFNFFEPDKLRDLIGNSGYKGIEIIQLGTVLYGKAIVVK